jgi:hypothetical protein
MSLEKGHVTEDTEGNEGHGGFLRGRFECAVCFFCASPRAG